MSKPDYEELREIHDSLKQEFVEIPKDIETAEQFIEWVHGRPYKSPDPLDKEEHF